MFAAVLLAWCSYARSAESTIELWPAYWKKHANLEQQAVIDAAYEVFRKQPSRPDTQRYRAAIDVLTVILQPTRGADLDSLASLEAGRAWMFLGELWCGVAAFDDCSASEHEGLRHLQSALEPGSFELGWTYRSVANTLGLSKQPARQRALLEDALERFDKSKGRQGESTGKLEILKALAILADAERRFEDERALRVRLLAEVESVFGSLHSETATASFSLGAVLATKLDRPREALSLLRRASEIRDQVLGSADLATADALFALGLTERLVGEYAQSAQSLERALAIRERALGPKHPDTAWALGNLAVTYSALARHADALPLQQRALAIQEKALGPEHSGTATALNNLANTYDELARHADALPLKLRALEIREKALGPEARATASALINLARSYSALARHAEALPLQQRALAILEKVQGPEHSDTATALANLANTYDELARHADALPLRQRALAILEKVHGPEHPDTATALNHLASSYAALARPSAALPLRQRALAIQEKALGPEHPGTATALGALANTYDELARYADALPLRLRALAIRERVQGTEHPDTATALNNLAHTSVARARYAEALSLQQRALAISEKVQGPDHPTTATAVGNLANTYAALARHADALPLRQRALAIREKVQGPEHPDTASALNNLASTYAALARHADALPLQRRALATLEKVHGPEHPGTATALNHLASTYAALARHADALLLRQRALAIQERALGPEHPGTATALNHLASTYAALARHADALPLQQRALAIQERALGPEHPGTATALNNLAVTYAALARDADALPLLQRALAIREKVQGPEHPDTASALNNLASTYAALARPADALPLAQRALRILENAVGQEHPDAAIAAVHLAIGGFRPSSEVDAIEQMLRAEQVLFLSGQSDRTAVAQSFLSWIYARSGQPDVAIYWGKRAVNTLQEIRSGLKDLDRQWQQGFTKSHQQTYQSLADLLFAQSRSAEAEEVLHLLKLQELDELVQRSGGDRSDKRQVTPTERERDIDARFGRLRDLQIAMAQERLALREKDKGGTLTARERARLNEIETRLMPEIDRGVRVFFSTLQREIDEQRARAPRGSERTADVVQLQSLLQTMVQTAREVEPDAQAVALQYVVTEERLSVVLTTPDGQPVVRQLPIRRQQLNTLVQETRLLLQAPDSVASSYLPKLQQLHQWLIAPVAADLKTAKARTLILSLNDILRYLPFAALHDGRRYLVQDYAIALHTAAGNSVNVFSEPPRRWNVAGMAATKAVGKLPALPDAAEEVKRVVGVKGFNGSAYVDDRFTRRQFQSVMQDSYNVLHVASHFDFVAGAPETSRLFLGDRTSLSLGEIKSQNWRFDRVRLMTLSACQTGYGSGTDAFGQEIEGLGALVQSQGAWATMVTLWNIADSATPLLMRGFYSGLAQAKNKAQSLQQAQVAFIEEGQVIDGTRVPPQNSHPYFWAPFILMGNWR